jgi:hypothetical protein
LLYTSLSSQLIFHNPVGSQEAAVEVHREGQNQEGMLAGHQVFASGEGRREENHLRVEVQTPGVQNRQGRHIQLLRVAVVQGDQREEEEAGSGMAEDGVVAEGYSGNQTGDQSRAAHEEHHAYHDHLRSFAAVLAVAGTAVGVEVGPGVARCVYGLALQAFVQPDLRVVLLYHLSCMHIEQKSPCS